MAGQERSILCLVACLLCLASQARVERPDIPFALTQSVDEIGRSLEMGETMMLGLRLAEGVSNQRFRRQLERLYSRADLIAFGHTHRAYVGSIGDTLLVNPGAVAPTLGEEPSAARIWLGHGEPEVEIVPLQSYASG